MVVWIGTLNWRLKSEAALAPHEPERGENERNQRGRMEDMAPSCHLHFQHDKQATCKSLMAANYECCRRGWSPSSLSRVECKTWQTKLRRLHHPIYRTPHPPLQYNLQNSSPPLHYSTTLLNTTSGMMCTHVGVHRSQYTSWICTQQETSVDWYSEQGGQSPKLPQPHMNQRGETELTQRGMQRI